MKKTAQFLLVIGAVLAGAAGAGAGESKTNAGWERLKSLEGDWEGSYGTEKAPTRVTYRLVSNGTALMETMHAPDSTEMITVYHPDGERLLMTHYCSENNQARMRSTGLSRDGKKLAFAFVDASNLPGPDAPHMVGLVLTFPDSDHLTQEWTHREKGKEDVGRFELARRK